MEKKVPSILGFRMPAEWEKREATWLSWPHNKLTWESIEEIEKTYTEIISELHEGEKVNVLVNDSETEKKAGKMLSEKKADFSQITFHKIETVDAWIRDYGPNFIVKTKRDSKKDDVAFNHWIFNAWGNKYEELKKDSEIPSKINEHLKMKVFSPGIVLEGGSVEVNGSGVCMTSEQCLLNKNRNPKLSKAQIEKYLRDYLGISEVLWLKEGIAGDDTDGHIDDIARFTDKNTVLCCFAEKGDEDYEALKENFEILKNYRTEISREKLKVSKLPVPKVEFDGQPLPASYANFYIAQNKVLVPVFEDKNDEKALKIIQQHFPERKIVGINCRKLVYGLGTIHCITQQQPM